MLALLEQLLPLTFLTLQSLLAVPQLTALAGCLSGFLLSYSSAPFPTCFACSFFIPQFIIAFLFPQTSGWHHDYHAHFFYTVYTIYTGCVHGFSPPPHLLLQKDTDLSHFLQRWIFEGQIVDVSHSCIYYDFQPVDMFLEHVLFTGPLSCGLLVN